MASNILEDRRQRLLTESSPSGRILHDQMGELTIDLLEPPLIEHVTPVERMRNRSASEGRRSFRMPPPVPSEGFGFCEDSSNRNVIERASERASRETWRPYSSFQAPSTSFQPHQPVPKRALSRPLPDTSHLRAVAGGTDWISKPVWRFQFPSALPRSSVAVHRQSRRVLDDPSLRSL
eukprot:g15957.t1